ERSRPIVAELFTMLDRELPLLSGKSKLAEIIRYTLSRRKAFERYLADGRIEIDSNIVERAIRPQTITRKYALFAGSDGGGRTWATIATLLTTAKMNGVDPSAWLTQTLERIASGWPNSQIAELMPWNFRPYRPRLRAYSLARWSGAWSQSASCIIWPIGRSHRDADVNL